MLVRLAYLAVTNGLAMLRLLSMSDRAKDVEILALRHQITVLETLQIISKAEAEGQSRLAEMNRQVADNLEKIITALEVDDPGQVADRSKRQELRSCQLRGHRHVCRAAITPTSSWIKA